MCLKCGKYTTLLLVTGLLSLGLFVVAGDSQARAGLLKNSVRVGDRSAMTLMRTPKPDQRKRIYNHSAPTRARAPNQPQPQSQAWFWDQYRTDADAAGPERWSAALESLHAHRA